MPKIEPRATHGGWPDALLQDVFEVAPDATVAIDAAGSIVFANTQAAVMFGYERTELLGAMVEILIPDRLSELHRLQRRHFSLDAHHRPMGTGLQLLGRRRDGSEFPVDISLSPIEGEGGSRVLVSIRDVTERLEMEARSGALEDLIRTKTDILSILSHELFTPVTTIQGTVATILNHDVRHMDETLLDELVRGVAAASARLRRLMRHVGAAADVDLGIARSSRSVVVAGAIVRGALEDVDLEPLERKIRLVAPGDLLEEGLLVDEKLAVLAIVVILENALALAPGEQVELECAIADGKFEIRISDLGPGIPEDARERALALFSQLDPSDSRRHGGAGLGLYLARRIVEAHGSLLQVLSRDPRGLTFVLPFPLAEPAARRIGP